MRPTSITEKNTAPGVICTAPWRLTKVKPLANFRLEVEFIDETHGVVEMSHRVKSDKAGEYRLPSNHPLRHYIGFPSFSTVSL